MVAARLALAWARVYTRGMPDGDRRARMDELASDLWEHAACGERRAAVQLEIAGRTARGVAADVAWRFAHRSGPLSLTTVRWAGWLAFALGTSLLILLTATSGVAPMLGLYVVDDGSAPARRASLRASRRRCSPCSPRDSRCSGAVRAPGSRSSQSHAQACRCTCSACGRCSSRAASRASRARPRSRAAVAARRSARAHGGR
jgi:hypothetical protein